MSNRHHNNNNSKFFFNKDKSKPKHNNNSNSNHNQKHNKPSLNKSFSDSKQKPAVLVISDSSDLNSDRQKKMQQDDVMPERQMQVHNDHNKTFYAQEGQGPESSSINEKPIHARTYEQRLNLKPQPDPKPAKKIKLNSDAQEQAVIIRFNAAKNSVQTQSIDSEDVKKIQKAKIKKAYPWLSKSTKEMEDITLRFHNEIVEFYDYIRPSKREHETRIAIFELVKGMILEKYPSAKIQYFGSFATKLYLPDGDIDITVLLDDIEEHQNFQLNTILFDAINLSIKCYTIIFQFKQSLLIHKQLLSAANYLPSRG